MKWLLWAFIIFCAGIGLYWVVNPFDTALDTLCGLGLIVCSAVLIIVTSFTKGR